MTRVLVTGGAGFVGANLAVALAARGDEVIALDNLNRRGSELNLPRLEAAGVRFVRGDVRDRDGLLSLEPIGALVECSAEPSVLASDGAGSSYAVETNLLGAHSCLELARRDGAQVVFLSTSRVYPLAALRSLRLREEEDRFELEPEQELPGASPAGISEDLPLAGARTLYGATKLAAELLVGEYAEGHGVPAVVNRCGVVAGPWQMARVDQGVFAHWVLSHRAGRPLTYLGYGGSGRQVRDLLHVDDLVDLVAMQLDDPDRFAGLTLNVGGGPERSLSLRETTALCREITGRTVPVDGSPRERPGDVPLYLSDCTRLRTLCGWRPRRDARTVLEDLNRWIADNEAAVTRALL